MSVTPGMSSSSIGVAVTVTPDSAGICHEAGEGRDPGLAELALQAAAGNGDALELLPVDGEGLHAQRGQLEQEVHAGPVGGQDLHLGNILGPDRFGGHDPGGGESGSGGQKKRDQTEARTLRMHSSMKSDPLSGAGGMWFILRHPSPRDRRIMKIIHPETGAMRGDRTAGVRPPGGPRPGGHQRRGSAVRAVR